MEDLKINSLLKQPLSELLSFANKIRKNYVGSRFEVCSIINAKSGLCSEDCKFCAQSSRYSADISKYPLKDKSQILKAAQRAKEIGAERFGIVTSGRSLTEKELDKVAEAIYAIKNSCGIKICASLGALNKRQLKILKKAGLSRYHHNIETSPRFYPQIVTTHDFRERVRTIKAAKSVGLEVCSGGIIGMGESWQDRIDMAMLLKKLDVDSIPINLLIPIKRTPLESLNQISCVDAIRTIYIFRVILKDKIIKIAAGREIILKDFQALGFMAGANGMLIGGYLTVRGRDVAEDRKLIEEIRKIWME
jgi:biotin synthase